jgi:hypothetical protein
MISKKVALFIEKKFAVPKKQITFVFIIVVV